VLTTADFELLAHWILPREEPVGQRLVDDYTVFVDHAPDKIAAAKDRNSNRAEVSWRYKVFRHLESLCSGSCSVAG
jgi:hypothetical protein